MLEKQQIEIDTTLTKCCFFSTMKLKSLLLLIGLMGVFVISSCSPNFGPVENSVTGGLRSGDSAITRDNIDALLNNRERPGLATGWGGEKISNLGYTQFTRASSKPVGTDIIYYNDPEGVEAMTSRKEKVGAMQTAAGSLIEWGVKGRGGYLSTYKDYGYGRRLVAGKKGSEYSIVIKNRCKSALEIVTSVDGLDVMDGKTASFSNRGYIIEPGDTLEIKGFRTSTSSVAAFEFSSVSNSYANMKHGDTRNVGVIGIAVFTQKNVDPWKWTSTEINKRDNARPFAQAP